MARLPLFQKSPHWTLLHFQQPIQQDFSSKVNRRNVTLTTHRHLVLWLQMSGAAPPLPYMLSSTGTISPFYWSCPILLRNPPGRSQENRTNMNTVLHMIHRAISTQHTVSDPNFTLVQVMSSNFSAVCRSMYSCYWL
jgi:hypothetical protein